MENNTTTTIAHRPSMDFDISATAAVVMSLVSAALFLLLMYFYYSCHCSEKRRMIGSRPPELPVVAYRKAGEPTSSDGCCTICLGDLKEGEELKLIPGCGHVFHPQCIDGWIVGHRSCPVCRCSELSGTKNAVAEAPVAEHSVVQVVEEEGG